RRPPPSPLFPYTTLFRSGLRLLGVDVAGLDDLVGELIVLHLHDQVVREAALLRRRVKRRAGAAGDEVLNPVDRGLVEKMLVPLEDRKSTRLNSSHVAISY